MKNPFFFAQYTPYFYQTLYGTKVTINEDIEPQDLVARNVTQKLLGEQDATRSREATREELSFSLSWIQECFSLKNLSEKDS